MKRRTFWIKSSSLRIKLRLNSVFWDRIGGCRLCKENCRRWLRKKLRKPKLLWKYKKMRTLNSWPTWSSNIAKTGGSRRCRLKSRLWKPRKSSRRPTRRRFRSSSGKTRSTTSKDGGFRHSKGSFYKWNARKRHKMSSKQPFKPTIWRNQPCRVKFHLHQSKTIGYWHWIWRWRKWWLSACSRRSLRSRRTLWNWKGWPGKRKRILKSWNAILKPKNWWTSRTGGLRPSSWNWKPWPLRNYRKSKVRSRRNWKTLRRRGNQYWLTRRQKWPRSWKIHTKFSPNWR